MSLQPQQNAPPRPQQGPARQGPAPGTQRAGVKVTYIAEDGDPPNVTWNGIRFKTNIPVLLTDEHKVLVDLPKEFTTQDGNVLTRTVPVKILMSEHAKGNHAFQVEGCKRAPKPMPKIGKPTTADGYRGYAQAWMANSTSADTMLERWDDEEALRDRCGVGDDDVSFLKPFFDAKVALLRHTATIEGGE